MDNKVIAKIIHGIVFGLAVFFITQFLIAYFPPVTFFYNSLEKRAYDVQINFLRSTRLGKWKLDVIASGATTLDYRDQLPWDTKNIAKSIYVIHYDDSTYEKLNLKNITRKTIAQCVDIISLGSPRVIGLDLIYSSDNPTEDPILAESLAKAGNVVIGGMVQSRKLDPPEIEALVLRTQGESGLYETTTDASGKQTKHRRELASLARLITKDEPVTTVPALAKAARGIGYIDVRADEDGIIRRIPYWVFQGFLDENTPKWGTEKILPTFSGMLFAIYLGREKEYLEQLSAIEKNFNNAMAGSGPVHNFYAFRDLNIMLNNEYSQAPGRSFLLDFQRPAAQEQQLATEKAGYFPEFFPSMKLEELLKIYETQLETARFELEDEAGITEEKIHARAKELVRETCQRTFKDRLVIIATSAKSDQDAYNIPLIAPQIIPGVEIHALGIATLLGGRTLQSIPPNSVFWFNLLLCAGTSIAFAYLHTLYAVLFLLLLTLALSLFSTFVLFGNWFFIVPIATPIMYLFINFLYHSLQKYYVQWREKAHIKGMFQKFVSPTVIEDMIANPDKFKLGGEKRDLTVFFSDIRSFTTYSEKHEPQDIVFVLNEYLTAMCREIKENNGTIDKLVGDEIMALFGAPIRYENHVEMAIRACIAQVKKIIWMWDDWQKRGIDYVDFGMGINSGEVICGFMGAEDFYNYTVIGDTVNLAARVEGLTRDYDCYLIMTEFSYERVKDIAVVNELDTVKVKGKNKPVVIYEVLGLKDDPFRFPKPRVSKKKKEGEGEGGH